MADKKLTDMAPLATPSGAVVYGVKGGVDHQIMIGSMVNQEDAPSDGHPYVRKDGGWTRGGSVDSVNGKDGVVSIDSADIPHTESDLVTITTVRDSLRTLEQFYGRAVNVADLTDRLGLSSHPDVTIAVQTDNGTVWVLPATIDPSVSGNWINIGNLNDVSIHVGQLDPHTQYLNEYRGDARYILKTESGIPLGVAPLNSQGKVDLSYLPPLAAGRRVIVADQDERLALSAWPDLTIAIQSDDGSSWLLDANADPSVPSNWTLNGNTANSVSTFNSRTGNVLPISGDYTADQITQTLTREFVTPSQKTLWNNKLSDAPVDGVSYLRKNGAWTPAPAGGSVVVSVNDKQPDMNGNVQLTKDDLGLGNVDNTSDMEKPASLPTQEAILVAISVKQDTLVSGSNIKTVNGNSLLGSGNIEITSGVSSVNGQFPDISGNVSLEFKTLNGQSITGVGDITVGGVNSVNGAIGDVEIVAGNNITITSGLQDQIVVSAEISTVRTPTPIYPLSDSIDISVNVTLSANAYANVYGVARNYREFQVDFLNGDFSSPVTSQQLDADSWMISPAIPDDTDFKWRCRDADIEGNISSWTVPQSFKTFDIYIQTPSIVNPVEGGFLEDQNSPVVSSDYVIVNSPDSHAASFWEIYNGSGALMHSSGRSTTNLLNYQPPLGVIVDGETFSVRVRYESSSGILSSWSAQVSFTGVSASYASLLAIGFNTFEGSYNHYIYGQDVDTFNLLPPNTDTGNVAGLSFSPNGEYLAMGKEGSGNIAIYKRDGDTFTRLAQPSILPAGNSRSVAFDGTGTYLAVAHDNSPYITIYKRSGDTFTKLPNPSGLPTSSARGVAFSPDSGLLVVTTTTTPYVALYSRSGDTFTRLPNLSPLPTALSWACHFSVDNYLYIGQNALQSILCYSYSGGTFTQVAIPSPLVGLPTGITTSTDGGLVAYAAGSPGCCLLKNTGGSFSTVQTFPVDSASVSLSRNGNYLCIGGNNSAEYVAIYKRDTGLDTYTKIVPSPSLPTAIARNGISFWPSSHYPLS